jgi:hypothetical protein
MTTSLLMPAYPTISSTVSSDGHVDVQLVKSSELDLSTGTILALEERQIGAVVLITVDLAAAIMTTVQTYALLFNNDAVSSNLMSRFVRH